MEYVSTRNTKNILKFKEVFLKGLAPDGGLFIPKKIPTINLEQLNKLSSFSYTQLAEEIIFEFCKDEFNKDEIRNLVQSSYKNFRHKNVVHVKKIGKLNLLELFYGPTLAFKDIAMQIIGNMYSKILEKYNLKINIVVATSGDTGAAAISAIKDRPNMKIFVIHPENKISEVQRKFMTTVTSNNVFNIALKGNFDDCQKVVKSLFNDKKFSSSINMSGVNSINWSRIVAQIVYYFFSYFKIAKKNEQLNFSVPTGNFGDIYAGYIAKKMGLPINKLLIATNKNDILKRVINTGIYKPLKTEQTISPSMDIQIASNFERLLFDVSLKNPNRIIMLMDSLNEKGEFKIEKEELKIIKESFCAESLSEEETKFTIKDIYNNHNILVDPHTAVGIGAIKKFSLPGETIVLSTAHPAKFSDAVEKETNKVPELPKNLQYILDKKESYQVLSKDLENIKNYILKRV